METIDKPATLLDCATEMAAVEQALIEGGGDVTEPAALARYEAAVAALWQKTDSFGFYVKGLEAKAEVLKRLAWVLEQKQKACERHVERLMKYADVALGERDSLKGEAFTIFRKKNPGRVEVVNEKILAVSLPEAVLKETVYKVDKARVREALKAGREVLGAVLVEGSHVEIR